MLPARCHHFSSWNKRSKYTKEMKEVVERNTKMLQVVIPSLIKDMIKILMKILKALMKKFKVYAHPKVCLLSTIAILINHV